MNSINSISKGTFLFKNGKNIKQLKKKKKVDERKNLPHCYDVFTEVWNDIEKKIEKIQSESYERTLKNLISFITDDANKNESNLQTAVLLTGINQTDHFKQFDVLSEKISNNCFSHVTILNSRNCPNIKSCIETLVGGLVYNRIEFSNESDDEHEENIHVKLKKKQLTMSVLEAHYNNKYKNCKSKPKLVIMLTDFEQFSQHVMQDFISILCSYTTRLPLVLVLGVATAFKTIHNVLPFHITNRISVNIFQTETSSCMMNRILNEVILTHHCTFFLSGKSFKVLLDIFLFYDYSLHSFVQGFKMFMFEQYTTNVYSSIYYKNGTVLIDMIDELSHDECEWIRRHCTSFRQYVESQEDPQMQIDLIENDKTLKQLILKKCSRAHRYFFQFFCCLRMLAVMIEDLPRNNLGKQLRELYPICSETEITKLDEFQECFKLLRFSSKDEFLVKLDKVIDVTRGYVNDETVSEYLRKTLNDVHEKIKEYRAKIANAGMTPTKCASQSTTKASTGNEINKKGVAGRHEMLQKLKESAIGQPSKVVVEYEKFLWECLDFIQDTFARHLCPFSKGPVLSELFVFNDSSSVRPHIIGAPRSSLHNALINPHYYLQCKCCASREDEQILPTMPEVCVAYQLHLECNKFINLFDWLQSFSMVLDSTDIDDEENISPEIQAKFTRSVAELQFLGFIKQAKQKTDHVMRMTW